MHKIIYLLCFYLLSQFSYSQALPANRYYGSSYMLDETTQSPSFAYSLRKLKKSYTGFAIKVRRSADNAEANIDFDSNDVVSANSNVVVTTVGTSGLVVGQILNFVTFKGASTLFVATWYDQSANNYLAEQSDVSIQPILTLNSVNPSNVLPSILFSGTAPSQHLKISQPIEKLTTTGINGSVMLVCKPTANSRQTSFGAADGSSGDWRWAIHMNWEDARCYFDASEVCCAANRSFPNGASLNSFKQYSFIRGGNYKTVKLNNVFTGLNNSPAASVSRTGGAFYLGAWTSAPNFIGFKGNVSEAIMFPTDLSNAVISPLISNEILYWGL